MRRAPFNFSPRQTKQLRNLRNTLQLEFHALELEAGINLDYRWARSNALIDSIEEWQQDDNGRLRRYMQLHKDEVDKLTEQRDEINNEYRDLKTEPLEEHVRAKMERFLDKSISSLFRDITVFVAKATCSAELSESGRRSRVSQLGFEGGTIGYEGLSGRQIAGALIAIFLTFLVLAVAQELPKEKKEFGNVFFLTFLMLFTYGAALIIALDLKRRVGMGYNELTRQRSWSAYVAVGIITALSWLFVSFSYRYIVAMLQGTESDENMEQVLTSIKWSYPYALQSLALAVSISWILDYHQSHGMSGRLKLSQRFFDVGVSIAALGIASVIAYCWMDGKGWFEGSATRGPEWIEKNPLSAEWLVIRGMAVAAVVGWLVPMWFYINRSKAPDQIAGRLITMNKKGLAAEIRNLTPDELIRAIAAVAASIAAIDNDVNRNERDVYHIICGHLAGLPNSDVDIDSAEKEFDHCIDLIEREELQLEERLKGFRHLPLLSSLMPFIASSVAFADGVYLEQEREIVHMIQNRCA